MDKTIKFVIYIKKFIHDIFSIEQIKEFDRYYKIVTIFGFQHKYFDPYQTILECINNKVNHLEQLGQQLEQFNNYTEARINRLMQINLSTTMVHQKTFLPFKARHYGENIVLVATGPSASKYTPQNNVIHIGVNRAFELTNIDFKYMFIQDYSGKTKEYIDGLNNYKKDTCTKFYGLTTEYDDFNRVMPESDVIKANALRYRTDWSDVAYFEPKFAYDISSQPLGCFCSVIFPALQFALWTNPAKIYLVGCDCTMDGYVNSNDKNFLAVDNVLNAFHKFKEFANRYYPDTEIISINPVGLKGLFKEEYRNNAES